MLFCFFKDMPGNGKIGAKRLSHAHKLRSLPWKQKNSLGSYHLISADPHAKPAPNVAIRTRSPFLILDCLTASSSATAIEAADMLPYLSRLTKTLSEEQFNFLATA